MQIFNVLKDDKNLITYRPKLNQITGSITATILLQQIIFRFDGKPFYKFKQPCEHEKYRDGDSWCEELGFSKSEFDTALKKIAKKVKKGQPKPKDCFVWYWTNMDRVTYYDINLQYLNKKLSDLYKAGKSIYEKQESRFTKSRIYDIDNTENNTKNNTKILAKSEILETDNDFIDFNELQKQNKKIGISGQIKAIVQSELNYLTFDAFDNKIIDRMIKSIIANLTAFKRKKKDFTKTTNDDIVEAFKTALNSIISKSVETPTLSYVNSCLNPNLYIKELQQNNETDSDLEPYKTVVKKIFSHYHRFTKSDLNNLKTIIKAIEETGSKDVLFDFKFIMNNLPDYILESISLQSISYLANKINDLVRTCSLEAKIRSHERFILISQSFGKEKAYQILTKTLTKNLL